MTLADRARENGKKKYGWTACVWFSEERDNPWTTDVVSSTGWQTKALALDWAKATSAYYATRHPHLGGPMIVNEITVCKESRVA